LSEDAAAPLPLHTRALTLEARADGAGGIKQRGEVLDVRKRGLVPVPGSLQLPGIIHRMEIDADLDTAERRLVRIASRQPVVAFEASARSEGESCRDSAPALQALAGARLDGGFLRRLSEVYGGPRGCTHLLTLARLLAGTAARIFDSEAEIGAPPRAAGERIFRRVLVVDGFEHAGGRMEIALSLSDVHLEPDAAAGTGPFDRLAAQGEVRATVVVDILTTTIRAIRAEERHRSRTDLAVPFASRDAELADLVGRPLMVGFGAVLVDRFGAKAADAPFLDALLNLAPGYVQCVAAVTDLFLPGGRREGAAHLGAGVDSCFMWRAGGPLQRLVASFSAPQQPATPLPGK
jgi:hypothetical protein